MTWIGSRIRWIMVIAGLLTCTMLYAAIAPQEALRSTFGEALAGPLADIVVRSWGTLVALVGAMLIYGAYHPPVRSLVLIVAGLSKLCFIGLMLAIGRQYLGRAGLAVGLDLVMVLLFAAHLAGWRRG